MDCARTALLTQLNVVTRHTSGLGKFITGNAPPIRSAGGMAREMESAEYSAIRKNFTKLKEVVTRGDIPATLFEEDLITQDVLRTAVNDTLRQDKRANDILGEVLDAVRISPAKINSFLDALEAESIAKDIAQNVRGESVWVHIYYGCGIVLAKSLAVYRKIAPIERSDWLAAPARQLKRCLRQTKSQSFSFVLIVHQWLY